MPIRLLSLVALHLALRHVAPPWPVMDWNDPRGWAAATRTEDITAEAVRILAVVATGLHLLAHLLWLTARLRALLTRRRRTVAVRGLRRAAPLALVAGLAIPAGAADQRLPFVPPPARLAPAAPSAGAEVVVEPGDSLWRIATRHTPGRVEPYWVDLVDLNRPRFPDVDLIHPGDTVLLPPGGR